ncbi:protein of unknown function [Magnetospira sp. QH-2]|nr:protein of unknown function [Magnetospira sp. QH-2]
MADDKLPMGGLLLGHGWVRCRFLGVNSPKWHSFLSFTGNKQDLSRTFIDHNGLLQHIFCLISHPRYR